MVTTRSGRQHVHVCTWLVLIVGTLGCTTPDERHRLSKVEQVSVWFAPCVAWTSTPVKGNVNTYGDEYAPVIVNDSTMFFTRSRHVSTMCNTSDVFLAYRRDGEWITKSIERPVNDCHENSALSFNRADTTVLLYGQYYLANSNMFGKRTLSPSYPSDAAQTSTIPYVFDPVTDYQPNDSPPVMTPMIRDHTKDVHARYRIDNWASSIIDNRGDIYVAKMYDGGEFGFPKRLDWPLSGGDFESDAVITPNGEAMVFVSDRPNDIYEFEGKEPYTDASRLHNWGNTNIYVVPRANNEKGVHYILANGLNTALAERTPAFSANGDTMYFSSNGLPGYGGMDVYFSVRLRQDSWLYWSRPRNLGRGINTADDELWFTPSSAGTHYFARRVHGKLDIFEARRERIIEFVSVFSDCYASTNPTITTVRYDGSTSVREIERSLIQLDDVPNEVHTFSIATSSADPPRHFQRCNASSDTLELTYSDLTVYPCKAPSATTTSTAVRSEWTFSDQETRASIERVLQAVAEYIATTHAQPFTVAIKIAPSHDVSLFAMFERRLSGTSVSVSEAPSTSQRSTITLTLVN